MNGPDQPGEPRRPAPGTAAHPLAGRVIAITGRLASMTREAAIEAIVACGAHYAELVDELSDVLVLGLEGWPLQRDGRPTRSLARARELVDAGHTLRIVDEAAFLVELGLHDRAEDLAHLYTLEQLTRLLREPIARLRAWMRRGLIAPVRVVRRLCYFDFAQVANARALQRLLDAGASLTEIERSLRQLDGWMPGAARALMATAAASRGGALLLHLEDGRVVEPSGQQHFVFEDAPKRPAPTHSLPAHRTERSAEAWFDRGVAAEAEGRWEEAADCYHHSLLAGGPRAEVAFNLGNALHALGRSGEAAQRYMNAVEIDGGFAEAWNNLGNALAELGRFEAAIRAYHKALAILPEYADAHFNLAETLHQLERWTESRTHWLRYLAGAPHSQDRAFVRRRIGECDAALAPARRDEGAGAGHADGG
ncbi:MAG: tetratricopeptide repeat protein [Planctomycetes bacterium]|nr:tetratricopeptide repeat protein [Planctomycetota bacterium]